MDADLGHDFSTGCQSFRIAPLLALNVAAAFVIQEM